MTLSLWNVAMYSLQLAGLVTVALAAAWALGLRMPRHALRFWQLIVVIAILIPLAQPRAADSPLRRLISEATATAVPVSGGPLTDTGTGVTTVLLAIIGAGVAIKLLWLAVGLIRVRTIVARTEPAVALTEMTADLSRTLQVNAAIRITDDLEGPATVGARSPIVLLPRMALQLPATVQRAILCHELVHVKRRDWLHTIGEELWCAILWFHPCARVVASRLSLARETVVDEATIRITRDRRAYAEALLAFSDPQPHVIGVTPFIGRRTLSQRISLIAEEGSMSRRRAMSGLAIAIVACLGITVASIAQFPMSATASAQSHIYEPADGITLPVAVYEVKPEYTPEAMQKKIQGSVWMTVVINDKGDVADVQIQQSLDAEFGLDRQALDAARLWKFRPGQKDGTPVAVRVTVEMRFALK